MKTKTNILSLVIFLFFVPQIAGAGICAWTLQKALDNFSGIHRLRPICGLQINFTNDGDTITYLNHPLYSGKVTKVPLIEGFFNTPPEAGMPKWIQAFCDRPLKGPRWLKNRASTYKWRLSDQPWDSFGIGTKDSSFLITINSGQGADFIYRFAAYQIPEPLKYVSGGHEREIFFPGTREAAKRLDGDLDISEYDLPIADLIVISLRESDFNGGLYPDELRRELSYMSERGGPDNQDTYHDYDIPRDRRLTWIMRPSQTERDFNWKESFRLFKGPVVRIPQEGDFSGFENWRLEGKILTLEPSVDSNLIDLRNPGWRKPIKIDISTLF